ncbi:nitroreductase [Mesorhizobium sp. INR15]|nr:nitroreductase [Mesorhizobium sp. INR15]
MKKSSVFSHNHKICLRRFDGSCKGSGTSGDWGRPVETRVKGRPMLKNNTRFAGDAEIVDEAILSRRSVRAFLPDMVDDDTIRAILTVAARAPSGTNMQPWRVYVTKGESKQKITDAILNSGIRAEKADWDEYRYYPTQFFEPYLTRRRANGFGLYGALGIGRREVDKMRAQHDRNFVFFDAPVGMIFTIDRRLNQGSWIDYGMFLQNIMVAARGRGLHTCPQAAFAPYHRQIRPVLNIPDEEIVVCGMALGHEDTSKPENTFRTDRVPLEEWVSFSE